MDYLQQSYLFQAKKVARYLRLYGASRTWIKVKGQYHMRKRFDRLPPRSVPRKGQRVTLIGCGNFAFSNIAYYLRRTAGNVIGACMDVDVHRAASMSRAYSVPFYTTEAPEIFSISTIDLVYIASNHASHAEYAIDALRAGKHVYIEKPHVVSEDQLRRLTTTIETSSGKVFLGFIRPGSRFGRLIGEYLDRETGKGMYSWFIGGHEIDPGHWYFSPQEGGRVLGNLCHWTDFLIRLPLDRIYPLKIIPTRSTKSDCDIAVTYVFGDGSIAAITFSAKGHAFEGVKERFSAHRGNCLIMMDDFKTMTIDVADKKRTFYNLFRDHGHRGKIIAAFDNVSRDLPYDRQSQARYIWDTGWLFLKTREALERNESLIIEHSGRPDLVYKP